MSPKILIIDDHKKGVLVLIALVFFSTYLMFGIFENKTLGGGERKHTSYLVLNL